MKSLERISGFVLLALCLFLGRLFLSSDQLFFRLLIGMGFGYSLTRGYTGFAGSVNRAYKTGSTRLIRSMMLMFFLSALLSAAFLYHEGPGGYDLWINPINLGLLLGGALFGFGMSFSSCCASGLLTDLVTALPRGILVLFFSCFGVFMGFGLQNSASWIRESWWTSPSGHLSFGGVYFPDFFLKDGLRGYLGAICLTALFCSIVVYLAYAYENYRKQKGTYTGHFSEKIQDLDNREAAESPKNWEEWYHRLFIRSWSLREAAIIISVLFALLFGVTKAGWRASTPYGIWFGHVLLLLGVDVQSLADFTLLPAEVFTNPFFENPTNLLNLGIIAGTAFFLLSSGTFSKIYQTGFQMTLKQGTCFAMGGFLMGLGTRLANGCNVGGLYTPIATFSLAGWILFVFILLGGILGNYLADKLDI